MTYETAFSRTCYTLTALLLAALFFQNFLFSADVALLRFREIDDTAFQEALRHTHSMLEHGNYRGLLTLNFYAYGWIYWFPLALLTFPFYFLSIHFGIDWPLIVFPRQCSWLFHLGCLYLLHRLLRRDIRTPQWVPASAVLIYTLFPTFGYFSMRFGTVAEVTFFSLLSLYLALSNTPSTRRGRIHVAIALGIAGGIKLSGLLIAPVVLLAVLARLDIRKPVFLLQEASLAGVIFVFCFIFSTDPELFAYPFNPQVLTRYLSTLQLFMEIAKNTHAVPLSTQLQLFFADTWHTLALLLLSAGFCIQSLRERRIEPMATLALLIGLLVYLLLTIGDGAALYFTSLSVLFVLGIVGWSQTRYGMVAILSILLLLAVNLPIRAYHYAQDPAQYVWQHAFYAIKYTKTIKDRENAQRLEECLNLPNSRNWNGHVMVDYTIPTRFNILSFPHACISTIWGNFSPENKSCAKKIDYLILDETSPGAQPAIEFEKALADANAHARENLMTDRKHRQSLIYSGGFAGQQFTASCKIENYTVYRAQKH